MNDANKMVMYFGLIVMNVMFMTVYLPEYANASNLYVTCVTAVGVIGVASVWDHYLNYKIDDDMACNRMREQGYPCGR